MSITTKTELQSFMGSLTIEPAGGQEALDTAEILVAAYIEADTLAQTVRAEEITPVRNRDTLEVTLAPVVTFTSITYGDPAETVSNTSADKWLLKATNGFSAGTVYTANYTSEIHQQTLARTSPAPRHVHPARPRLGRANFPTANGKLTA